MVPRITHPEKIRKAVYYNEHKVAEGVATFLHAANFLQEGDDLTTSKKIERFESLNDLNKRSKVNTLHISLNFAPGENFDKEKLVAIANRYMELIGFSGQPYLVYEHHDSGHPHIHIVTNSIREDGTRIDFHNIGKNESSAARKQIEKEFDLVRAEKHERLEKIRKLDPQKVLYGKSETKQGISNVLDEVLDKYKYSSLAELNAILRIYNVKADIGLPGSRQWEKGGLFYRALDKDGKEVGVPIKASSIYSKPTLHKLKDKFTPSNEKNPIDKKRVKAAIDWILMDQPESLKEFMDQLAAERIEVILRTNGEGMIYGITFVDLRGKVVFNGSEIGRNYSAKKILESLGFDQMERPLKASKEVLSDDPNLPKVSISFSESLSEDGPGQRAEEGLLETITRYEDDRRRLPLELRKQKRNNRHHPPL